MRRNILLATAAIAALALVSGCNKPNNQSNNASADAGQSTSATETASNENGTANTSRHARASESANENGATTPTAEVSDIGFANNAAIGDMYEIAAGRLALERSQSESVKQFAQEMIDAHSKTTTGLKGALPPSNVQMLPADLDVPHQNMLAALKNASDQDFDNIYLAQQKDAHQQALALFQNYADNGDEATLKKFAQDTLPAIEQHLDRVASLTSHTQVALNSHKKSHKHK